MITDYIRYFEEFDYPMVFIFQNEEEIIYNDLQFEDGSVIPDIVDRKLVLECKLRINDAWFTLDQYNKHLSELSKSGILSLIYNADKAFNKLEFLKGIDRRISDCFRLFNTDSEEINKFNCTFLWNDGILNEHQKFSPIPLRPEEVGQDLYKNMYLPFVNLQYQSLIDFKKQFIRKFEFDLRKRRKLNKGHIRFEYSELYWDLTTRKEVKEAIEDLMKSLSEKKQIGNITTSSLLFYFGLTSKDTKINWIGDAGDFYSFNKWLKDNNVLHGHTYLTLSERVIIKDWNKWDQFHSLKPTLNEGMIISIAKKFKEKIDRIRTKVSS